MQLLYHHRIAAHPYLLATTACSKLLQKNILWESPLDAVDHCLKKLFLGTEESGLVIQPLIQQNSFKSVVFRIFSYTCRQNFPIFILHCSQQLNCQFRAVHNVCEISSEIK